MNGNSQSFVILNGIRSNPNEVKENAIRNSLPVYDNPSELQELENSQKDISVRATAEVMNEMLKMKFSGIDIQKFMEIYTKLHIGEAFALPVPPIITCTFKNMTSAEEVQNFLSGHQRLIGEDGFGRSFLNLHTDNVYEFTIIRAHFNLAEDHKSIYHGYYYDENEKFAFFIKSSAQFDLTVVYSEK